MTHTLVPRQQIGAVADLIAPKKKDQPKRAKSGLPLRRNGPAILDMRAEFEERGLLLRELSPGKFAVSCPWQSEHSGVSGPTETVLFEPAEEGAVWGFRCMHNSCSERSIKEVWQEFRPEPAPREPSDPEAIGTTPEHLIYIAPEDQFFHTVTFELWPLGAVDRKFPVGKGESRTSSVIAAARTADQISWLPGQDVLVRDTMVSEGGITHRPGFNVANRYRKPEFAEGDPSDITLWLDHLQTLYPDTWEHIASWCAHRIQRPWQKVNHALVLGGKQGIGKDSLLEPLKHGVGVDNFSEISPRDMSDSFNDFMRSIVLRVSEAYDLGGESRFHFYEKAKTVITAPPNTVRVNAKYLRPIHIPNVTGVIFTTNHRDGLWLEPDDRRHHVSWCDGLTKADFTPDYWTALYRWYEAGGTANVIAWLSQPERLVGFDAMNPPPQTDAWREMVGLGVSHDEQLIEDALEKMGRPEVFRVLDLYVHLVSEAKELAGPKNRRRIPHLLEAVGYRQVRKPGRRDGRWMYQGEHTVLYARDNVTEGVRQQWARDFASEPRVA